MTRIFDFLMSIAALAANSRSAEPTNPAVDFSPPVVRPKPGTLKLIGEVLRHGGPGYLQFAITNICNAKCDFCGFAVDRLRMTPHTSIAMR